MVLGGDVLPRNTRYGIIRNKYLSLAAALSHNSYSPLIQIDILNPDGSKLSNPHPGGKQKQ